MSSIGLWPAGTSAMASSTHPANYAIQCSCNRTYDASNVMDGDNATFWNDDTSYVWPDTISLALPISSNVNLTGLSILSSVDGYITNFNVSVLHGQTWTTTHQIQNASQVETELSFFGLDVANSNGVLEDVLGLSIVVLGSQNEFSRIAEIRPVYDASARSSGTSNSTSGLGAAATTTATGQPHTGSQSQKGLIIGLSVMAVVVALLLAGGIYWMCTIKSKRRQQKNFISEPVLIDYERPEMDKQPIMLTHETPALPRHADALPQSESQLQQAIELPVTNHNREQERYSASYHLVPQELSG